MDVVRSVKHFFKDKTERPVCRGFTTHIESVAQ